MKSNIASAVFITAMAVSAPALAANIDLTLDGTWYEFGVGGEGDTWRSLVDDEVLSFNLTASSAFELRLVDLGFAGDRLSVSFNGAPLGATGAVPVDDTQFSFSADETFAAPTVWSQGVWSLGPGSYTFDGTALAAPFGPAAWAISAVQAPIPQVPEPATGLLMLAGLAAVGAASRRRRG